MNKSENSSTFFGTLKFFDAKKGFGFIVTDVGDVHVGGEIGRKHLSMMIPGITLEVTYTDANKKGRSATSLDFPRYRGTVKWYSPEKGYGFITCCDLGKDVFLHASKLTQIDVIIDSGDEVEFFLVEEGPGRYAAEGLRLLEMAEDN